MNVNHQSNYERIAKAIGYINDNFKDQPTLNDIANEIHLSPFHFQRLFTEWAGVSPKKYMQFLSIEYAKNILQSSGTSLLETAYETGLSGAGRLHDLFVKIEGMTPGEYKKGGSNLSINYSYAESPFGRLLIASTQKGICHLSFTDNSSQAIDKLKKHFPNAVYSQVVDKVQQKALHIFNNNIDNLRQIKLHLFGTPFQLKVWQCLLKIPSGDLSTYGTLAKQIDNPNASRAVGSAIGSNPIAYLIPCHRVIQSSGKIGDYRWGTTRKSAIIGWEASKVCQIS